MKVAELKKILDANKITYPKKAKREDLIQLVKNLIQELNPEKKPVKKVEAIQPYVAPQRDNVSFSIPDRASKKYVEPEAEKSAWETYTTKKGERRVGTVDEGEFERARIRRERYEQEQKDAIVRQVERDKITAKEAEDRLQSLELKLATHPIEADLKGIRFLTEEEAQRRAEAGIEPPRIKVGTMTPDAVQNRATDLEDKVLLEQGKIKGINPMQPPPSKPKIAFGKQTVPTEPKNPPTPSNIRKNLVESVGAPEVRTESEIRRGSFGRDSLYQQSIERLRQRAEEPAPVIADDRVVALSHQDDAVEIVPLEVSPQALIKLLEDMEVKKDFNIERAKADQRIEDLLKELDRNPTDYTKRVRKAFTDDLEYRLTTNEMLDEQTVNKMYLDAHASSEIKKQPLTSLPRGTSMDTLLPRGTSMDKIVRKIERSEPRRESKPRGESKPREESQPRGEDVLELLAREAEKSSRAPTETPERTSAKRPSLPRPVPRTESAKRPSLPRPQPSVPRTESGKRPSAPRPVVRKTPSLAREEAEAPEFKELGNAMRFQEEESPKITKANITDSRRREIKEMVDKEINKRIDSGDIPTKSEIEKIKKEKIKQYEDNEKFQQDAQKFLSLLGQNVLTRRDKRLKNVEALIGMIPKARQITARKMAEKKAEERLREVEAYYKANPDVLKGLKGKSPLKLGGPLPKAELEALKLPKETVKDKPSPITNIKPLINKAEKELKALSQEEKEAEKGSPRLPAERITAKQAEARKKAFDVKVRNAKAEKERLDKIQQDHEEQERIQLQAKKDQSADYKRVMDEKRIRDAQKKIKEEADKKKAEAEAVAEAERKKLKKETIEENKRILREEERAKRKIEEEEAEKQKAEAKKQARLKNIEELAERQQKVGKEAKKSIFGSLFGSKKVEPISEPEPSRLAERVRTKTPERTAPASAEPSTPAEILADFNDIPKKYKESQVKNPSDPTQTISLIQLFTEAFYEGKYDTADRIRQITRRLQARSASRGRGLKGGMVIKQFDDKYFIAKDKGFGTRVTELPVRLTKHQLLSIIERANGESLVARDYTIAELRKKLATTYTTNHDKYDNDVPMMKSRKKKSKEESLKKINEVKNLITRRKGLGLQDLPDNIKGLRGTI